jgi:uncharacterized membrane protein (DUF2068 family)
MQSKLSVSRIDDIISVVAPDAQRNLQANGYSTVDDSPTRKRPWSVTIFSLLVLLLGSGLSLARTVWALRQANALADLPLSTSMPMGLLAATSLTWGVAFAICSYGLWRLCSWARIATLVVVTLYHVNIWFNHIVFDRSDYARQVLPFATVNSVVVLAAVWVFLNWPSIRPLYGDRATVASARENE